VKNANRPSARLFQFAFRIGVFTGLGAALAHCLFDNALAGALLGPAAYLIVVLLAAVGDIVAINRELAAFRNGEERD